MKAQFNVILHILHFGLFFFFIFVPKRSTLNVYFHTMISPSNLPFEALAAKMKGRLLTDRASRILYATDASVYRKLPLAVAEPAGVDDLVALIHFASAHKISLVPRTAGTSLAGQAIGKGVVVDFSVHFTEILELNAQERWVRVQPGVIRDELNRHLKPHGLWFSPNTSTASRCMMGGMVGNNSSGTTSIRYGVTRDKVIEAKVLLCDGSMVTLGPKSPEGLVALLAKDTLEAKIYHHLIDRLQEPEVAAAIRSGYPKASIHRRNTGYAVDALLYQAPFNPGGPPINLATLFTGAEGTLGLLAEVKLRLDLFPPVHEAVVCAHFESVHEAMRATVEIMKHNPYACELMDKVILDCTKDNIAQAENRFFLEGDPGAILAVEMRADDKSGLDKTTLELIQSLSAKNLGHAYPVIYPPDTSRVWDLRAAGLGVLSNMKGDAKPLAFVEDTAVELGDLPEYIADFESMMAAFGQRAVYYAHAGAGELHVRPVLNLKTAEGQAQFRAIGEASADLVAQYGGSLSGEHGDGRARSEFIPKVIGEANYALLKEIKSVWDPQNIFNPGNIVSPEPMDADFRYTAGQRAFNASTFLDFSEKGNALLAAEACNGSGDCLKPHAAGGTMCPSYQATLQEADSTRARANMLRETLTRQGNPAFPWGSDELHKVLDLCLSCKACKRECPSSVDMASLKAEADYHYQVRNGFSRRTRFFGHFHRSAPWASTFAPLVNRLTGSKLMSQPFKKFMDIAPERSIPAFSAKRAVSKLRKYRGKGKPALVLYIDEFTQYQDAHIAADAGALLQKLGYTFVPVYTPSGRAYMSKAMLPEAKRIVQRSVRKLSEPSLEGLPIVGLEPSAILGFRDDLQKLFKGDEKKAIADIAQRCFTLEEFLAAEAEGGKIDASQFHEESKEIHLHQHCHQKTLSHVKYSKLLLGLPKNYRVTVIPSGCCGMAGSFGYEAEHFALSQQIGNMVLYPHVRKLDKAAIVVAAGTSCRHQLADGVDRKALHPAQVLLRALK